MKKSFLIMLSLFVLLSSVLTVVASAETVTFPDDMYDDDVNVTYDAGTTATTKGSILDNIPDDGVGGFVGGVVESVFQDEDISEQVNDKAEGIFGGFSSIFDSFKDLIPSTNKQTTGSNFFDPINPVVGGGYTPNTGGFGANNISSTNAAINGESVDYNTTVNPYAKPTATLNPGDKGDGVKWLQWILIYTECGLQNPITGDYDDATAAAVKTLQLKYGINPDGIASVEVIEKAEQMYNDYINGVVQQGTTGQAVFNTVGSNTNQNNKPEKPVDIKITIIIVVLIIVWIFAIAIVFIIVHIKRKNITLSDDGEIIKPEKKEKQGKNKRRRELKDSRPITSSKTLLSLSDEAAEDSPAVADTAQEEPKAEASFEADVSNITLKTEFIEVEPEEEEPEEQAETVASEDAEKPQEEIKENKSEPSSEPEKEAEEAVAEKTEDAPTEMAEESEGVLKDEDENQSADDFLEAEESTSLGVVDVQEQFNTFTAFDDNYDDDGEMKISSLLEMKQRKAKAQAKDENKNS